MKKTIFITGATKNTGLGIARQFAADGWNVAVSSRDRAAAEETAQALAAEFGVDALGLAMDPAEVPSIRAAFAALKDRFGRLDAFVSNAANLGVGFSVLNSEESDWDAVVNANARGSFFGAQEAQRLMKDGGSIVFISSCHAKKAVPGRARRGAHGPVGRPFGRGSREAPVALAGRAGIHAGADRGCRRFSLFRRGGHYLGRGDPHRQRHRRLPARLQQELDTERSLQRQILGEEAMKVLLAGSIKA